MTDKQLQTLSKQTVFIQDTNGSHYVSEIGRLSGFPAIQKSNVYVLTEQEMNKVKRESAENAYNACLESIYQDPTADVEISKQAYLNTNYPLTKNTEG